MVFLCSFFLQSRGWLLPFQELLVILIASEPLCGTYYKPMRLASVVQHLRNKSFVNSVPDRMWVPAIERGSPTWRLTAADLCRRRQTVTAGLCRRRKTAMGVDWDRQSITPQAFPTVSVCASIQCCVYTEYVFRGSTALAHDLFAYSERTIDIAHSSERLWEGRNGSRVRGYICGAYCNVFDVLRNTRTSVSGAKMVRPTSVARAP